MVADLLGIFPRGLYLDELIKVTRGELHWECDYSREASFQTQYRNACLSSPDKYYAPEVIEHLSTKEILCSEFVEGVEIDTFRLDTQEVRDRIGALMLELTFRELFEFGIMQTDPNPANFLFQKNISRLNLLDFGATRAYEQPFLDGYMKIIEGAYRDDRD